ncbi:MAG: hypothetical protein AAGA96_09485 [Verrucomicrobiota bacterium]
MSRPSKTFLIEAGTSRFRVDLNKTAEGFLVTQVLRGRGGNDREDGSAASEGFAAFDPLGGTGFDTDWIAPLLHLRPKPATEVTILSDQVTVVVAEMPNTPGEDWRGNAEMEAQTISGLSSSEAIASTTQLPAEAGLVCCWTVQVAMRHVASMRKAISESSKSRLVAVSHPAGIRLDPAAPQLERWEEFALFHAAGGEQIKLRGWNGPDAFSEANEDGEVAVALLKAGAEGRLLLASPDSEVEDPKSPATEEDAAPEESLSTRVVLSAPGGAETWSAALARACDPLTGSILGLPIVSVPKPPPSAKTLATAATGIGLATALLLGGHYLLNQGIKSHLEEDLARFTEPAELVSGAKRRIADLERELAEIQRKQAESGASDVNVYAHRRRIGALLDGIAAAAGVPEAVVLDFKPDQLDTVLTGAATTFNAPQELAGRIDKALAANGWRAALVRRTAKLLRPDGGPWSYEIRLTPGRPVSVNGDTAEDDPTDSVASEGATSASVSF